MQRGGLLLTDPGQAFGTGAHATTKLVLCALQTLADEGMTVRRLLDVGTGSGILTIATAALWPESTGLAVDTDPLAISAATENFERNGVSAARYRPRDIALSNVTGEFDLVAANIRAPILLELRDALLQRVAIGGRIILSGLLANQVDAVAKSYCDGGAELENIERSVSDPDWCSARLRRP